MTRITNFGRKRTHLEASHFQDDSEAKQYEQPWDGITMDEGEEITGRDEPGSPPKKKRKRTKPSMRDGNTGVKAAQAAAERAKRLAEGGSDESVVLSKSAKKKKREMDRKLKLKELSRSEHRRVQRIEEKRASTTCFACREKGHAAKDCPVTNAGSGDKKSKSDSIVGICYRCGSMKHTLSRCKKPANNEDPLPYASCFVCGNKGHLASSCPQNKAKGVYPNGGSCKLCRDTSHLAKDCNLRQKDVVHPTAIIGTGHKAGADEDDFHSFKRHNTEMDREEEQEEKSKRKLDVRAGVHSGVVKAFGNLPRTSAGKVVRF